MEFFPAAKSIIASINTYCPPRKIAVIVGNPPSKLAGNYFLTSKTITAPLRLYTSKEDSMTWFREI